MTGIPSSDKILYPVCFVPRSYRIALDTPTSSRVLVELVKLPLLVYLLSESIAKICKTEILATNVATVLHSKMKICSTVLRSTVLQTMESRMFETSSKKPDSSQINENTRYILSMRYICSQLEHSMLY